MIPHHTDRFTDMKRYSIGDCCMLLHQKGSYVETQDVLKFLEDLEDDDNLHVILSKIRFMKEHLK